MVIDPAKTGELEVELGVPIPGPILPPERWVKTGIKRLPPPGLLPWGEIFGRDAPLILDLGCGNGRFVVSQAVQRPDCNYLGVDALPLVIRYATRRANQRGLAHVRFLVCSADRFLRDYVPLASVHELHLYHPQPYHDDAHGEQRLLTPEFLGLAVQRLIPDGKLVFQTDEPAYWEYWQSVAAEFCELTTQTGPWPDAPQGRTRREILARAQGLKIYRGWGVPRRDRSAEQLAALAARLPAPRFHTSRPRSAKRRPRRR